VELFWAISGFIFTRKYCGLIKIGRLPFGQFVTRRFSRPYPPHLATRLIVAALQWLYDVQHGETLVYLANDPAHFIMNLPFAG
jgi:peptidoglycan/LPS O-acetylase OafA/YrhL